jgi:hypothetical protein
MSYILVKDPASFQTSQKLLLLTNKINKAIVKTAIKASTSCEFTVGEDGDFSVDFTFFNENGKGCSTVDIYSRYSDEKVKDAVDFIFLYLKGQKSFSEMKEFAYRR